MVQGIKSALVTGGARRIGRAIALDLVEHGWAVAIHCNSSRFEAEALAHEIILKGGTAAVVEADLNDPDHIAEVVPAANHAIGPLTLLINNASLFEKDEAGDMNAALFEKHMRINVMAPTLLGQAFAAQRPRREAGNIVHLVDQRVWKLTPQFFSYTLSKTALWAATRTMAQAFAPHVRVNAIGPGPTLANVRQSATDFEKQEAATLLGHGPHLSEFGRTIRFLVDTPSITGQMIALDGGQHLAWETPDVVGIEE